MWNAILIAAVLSLSVAVITLIYKLTKTKRTMMLQFGKKSQDGCGCGNECGCNH
jgi:hypothetical protein